LNKHSNQQHQYQLQWTGTAANKVQLFAWKNKRLSYHRGTVCQQQITWRL